jgi:hypothetical protein
VRRIARPAPKLRDALSQFSESFFSIHDLPQKPADLDDWFGENRCFLDYACSWLYDHGNIGPEDGATDLVDVENKYQKFRAHWLDRLGADDAKARKTRDGWHRDFTVRLIGRAWENLGNFSQRLHPA